MTDEYTLPAPIEVNCVEDAVATSAYDGQNITIRAKLVMPHYKRPVITKPTLTDQVYAMMRHPGSPCYPATEKAKLTLVGDHNYAGLVRDYISSVRSLAKGKSRLDDDYNVAPVIVTGVLMLAEGDTNHMLVVSEIEIAHAGYQRKRKATDLRSVA